MPPEPAQHPPGPAGVTWAVALTSGLWIAICAAAPEFIWQGLLIVQDHLSWADLLTALLMGLILAFFVEPLLERVRDRVHPPPHAQAPHGRPRNAVYTAGLSLAFALVSVCLHDAIAAFVTARNTQHADAGSSLVAGITLATSWAIVPFAVTLAWLSVRQRLLRVPVGVVAAASPGATWWLFDWPLETVLTSLVPSLLILGLGYRQMRRRPDSGAFRRCANDVAGVAAAWLAMAVIVTTLLATFRVSRFELYDPASFWMDVRFYIGWSLGLMLAPSPYADPPLDGVSDGAHSR